MMEDVMSGLCVLVCGGRDFHAAEWAHQQLDAVLRDRGPFSLVIHGGAKGAAAIGGRFAERHTIPVRVYKADWDRDGRAAGVIRNQRMLDDGHPELVIAFHGGRGTADMVRRATKAGVDVLRL